MEFINRKVFLTKNLRPIDTNGDGVFNALVLSATTKTIQIPLRQSFDDMGIFEISDDDSFEIIDIGSVFDGSITDIEQPPGGIEPITNTPFDNLGKTLEFYGSGSFGIQQEILYCNDKTALNGQTLTNEFSQTLSMNVYVLTSSGGTEMVYEPNSLGVYPKFTITNTLCEYGEGGNDNPDVQNISNRQTSVTSPYGLVTGVNDVCQWTINSDWDDYIETAYSDAVSYCKSLTDFNYTRLLEAEDFIFNGEEIEQGDCDVNKPFVGVKLKNTWDGDCCVSKNGDGCETPLVTKYRHEYCFHCKS